MTYHLLAAAIILLFALVTGCERVDQAVDTYKKAKELKSDFQKRSDEIEKGIAEKTEGYKDRIRERVGLTTGEQETSDKERQDKEQPRRDRDD